MSAAAFELGAVADWLGTFALHSTCALVAAWLLSLALGARAPAFQERLLRFSLWVALVSSSVQSAFLGSPLALQLPTAPVAAASAAPALLEAGALATWPVEYPTTAPAAAPGSIADWRWPAWSWSMLLVGAVLVMAVGGAAWLLRAQLRLRRVLRSRQPETDPRVLGTAAEVARCLGLRQSPQLSRSPLLATPIAFGWWRPEVCLPLRVGDLEAAPLRALLAHEVAHLRRGDPAWMWLAVGLQALFPWQPLLVVVRRRWARLVELRCDAIAAQHSSPTAVARCLLDVAEWLRPRQAVPVTALGMAARPSALRERIEAALQPRGEAPPRRWLSLAFGGLSLSSLTLGAPGLHSAAPLPADAMPPAQSEAELALPEAFAPAPPSAEPAPPAPPVAAASSLRESFALLEAEHASLLDEVAQLRAELAMRAPSPALEQLVSALMRRLLTVERLRSRLGARVDRSPFPK